MLGQAFGATVARAPELLHGKTSPVSHDQIDIFAGLPSPFEATRYHSLTVLPETLGAELEPLAWAEQAAGQAASRVLMGMRHRSLPYRGVQFHPESVLTTHGPQLLRNFVVACGEAAVAGAPSS